jgi:glycosyltransferase involved in cell wall biosynthesis
VHYGQTSHADTPFHEPRFSVVIPVYNCARYVGETIQSVIDQRRPALEIIVVDDGSSDETAAVVQRYSDRVSLVYVYQQNQGPSAARNRGVALARGDWIAFLDADDLWRPDKLETLRRHIRDYPTVGFFWSDMAYIDENGSPREPAKWRNPLAEIIFDRPFGPPPSSVVMRKDVFNRTAGFNTLLRRYEDLEYFSRVAQAFPIRFIPRELLAYRKYDKEPRYLRMRGSVENWSIVNEGLSQLWRHDPAKRAVLTRHSASRYSAIGRHYLRSGNLERARYCFRQSFAERRFDLKNLRRWALSYLPVLRNFYCRAKERAVRA